MPAIEIFDATMSVLRNVSSRITRVGTSPERAAALVICTLSIVNYGHSAKDTCYGA